MSYTDDEFSEYWTDQITPMVGIAWLLTSTFWVAIFLMPKESEVVSLIVVVTMTLIAGILITPLMSAGLSAVASIVVILIVLAGALAGLAYYGVKTRKPAALAITGALAISLIGFVAAWYSFAEQAFSW